MTRYPLLAALMLAAIPAHHAAAQTYKFKNVDYKFHFQSGMTDINKSGDMVGGYWNGALSSSTVRECFVYSAVKKTKTLLNDPKATGGTECWGLNDAGTVVGEYINASTGATTGFIYSGGTFTDVNPPGAVSSVVYGVSNKGIVGGYFETALGGPTTGFLFDGTNYTSVTKKGYVDTVVFGVNSAGVYVVEATTSSNVTQSFLYNGSTVTPVQFPGAAENVAHHINDNGLVSATWMDSSMVDHGGVYDSVADMYYVINVPNATATIADGVNEKMELAGRYENSSGVSLGYLGKGMLAK